MSDSKIPMHKRMAMGQSPQRLKSGGPVLKSGFHDTPEETVKRKNGVVGLKDGGPARGKR